VRQIGRDHKLSIRKRVERLEAMQANRAIPPYREALIVYEGRDAAAESHLVLVGPADNPRCYFERRPGPGPQIADFGKFDQVLCVSHAENEA
jgi:hypothetical protein